MPKLPYMQFYVADWSTDCGLTMCSLSARGAWLELLCGMHKLDQSGVITGTADQLARICRCSTVEFVQAADELRANRVGEITERNGVYTIVNRRMRKEYEAARKARARQERFQNAEKTPNKREINAGEIRSQKSESELDKGDNKTPPDPPLLFDDPPDPPEAKAPPVSVFEFEAFWNAYGKKIDRTKCEKIYAKIREPDRAIIAERLPAYVKSTPDVMYRKNPQTWLNGKCWNDEIISGGGNERAGSYPRYAPKH